MAAKHATALILRNNAIDLWCAQHLKKCALFKNMQIPAFVREGNVPAQAAHFLEERTILRKKLRLDDRSINLTHYQ